VVHRREVRAGLSGGERNPQRVQDEVSGHVRRELPADDHPRVHVDHEAEVDLALPGPQVAEVADPQPVWRLGGEVALHEIRALLGGRVRDRGAPRLRAPLRARQARSAHQPRDLVTADLLAVADQRGVHPADP
jgi:hypothetical protein